MHQYVANRNVFRDCLKLFPPITEPRKLSGREFQTDGLATQKARLPLVAEPVVRCDQELSGGGSEMLP